MSPQKNHSLKMGLSIIVTVISLYLLCNVTKTFAQNNGSINLTVSPPLIELNSQPGVQINDKFRLRNNSNSPINLKVSIKKLSTNSIDGNPVPEELPQNDEFHNWISFDKTEFTAHNNEWTDVNYTINIPKQAAFGYYYVIEIGPSENSQPENIQGAKIQGRILISLLLNVNRDGANIDAKLTGFKPVNFVNEYLPVDFDVQVENLGNVNVKPRGNIFLKNGSKKSIDTLEVNQPMGSILPNSKRTYRSSWANGFIVRKPKTIDGIPVLDKNGKPTYSLQINWNKLTEIRFGRYTANLLMVYDNGKRDITMEGSTSFLVIPYKLIATLVISLLIVILIIRQILRSYIKKQLQRK